jgi:hypothetical protein
MKVPTKEEWEWAQVHHRFGQLSLEHHAEKIRVARLENALLRVRLENAERDRVIKKNER